MLESCSEFRSTTRLGPPLDKHKHWNKIKGIISVGVTYPLEDLPEAICREDLEHMNNRGNHKSAMSPETKAKLMNNYKKEVQHGWILPVALEYVSKIKGTSVVPVGVSKLFSIDDKDNREVKR